MLSSARVHATLPCSDFERAKRFYNEKLGLTPSEEQPGGAFYSGADGSRFLLFPSGGTSSGDHTQLGLQVTDIEAEVRELKGRGLTFEEYDMPGFDKATSVASRDNIKSAWFKDSEGNLLGIVQLS